MIDEFGKRKEIFLPVRHVISAVSRRHLRSLWSTSINKFLSILHGVSVSVCATERWTLLKSTHILEGTSIPSTPLEATVDTHRHCVSGTGIKSVIGTICIMFLYQKSPSQRRGTLWSLVDAQCWRFLLQSEGFQCPGKNPAINHQGPQEQKLQKIKKIHTTNPSIHRD